MLTLLTKVKRQILSNMHVLISSFYDLASYARYVTQYGLYKETNLQHKFSKSELNLHLLIDNTNLYHFILIYSFSLQSLISIYELLIILVIIKINSCFYIH
jgi:hypothetical protein